MIGAAIIVLVIIVLIPVGLMMSGGVVAAAIGWVLRTEVDARNEGSELLDLNG